MKKTNRLASLFLAMLMAFSLMAVTASACDSEDSPVHTEACEDEGIMPLYPMKGPPCPYCGCEMSDVWTDDLFGNQILTRVCSRCSFGM